MGDAIPRMILPSSRPPSTLILGPQPCQTSLAAPGSARPGRRWAGRLAQPHNCLDPSFAHAVLQGGRVFWVVDAFAGCEHCFQGTAS